MSIRQGSNIISGAKSRELGLFTPQWFDYTLNDLNWIRADSFSWHNGAIYTTAYQHLINDIQDKEPETETVSGVSITFYRADDGHKIVNRNQESKVQSIYEATGISWYYIVDTTNHLFKLPRSRFDIYGGSQVQPENMCLYFFAGNFSQTPIENIPVSPITGEVDWGAIGGILSDQTDLQSALDEKVSKSGDTMTGSLVFSDGNSNHDATIEHLDTGGLRLKGPNTHFAFDFAPTGGIYPSSSLLNLGTSFSKWNRVCVKQINNGKDIAVPNATGTMALTSDIGDATLTIQKNSTTVDTFTANAKTDKTINITVPTTPQEVNALPDTTKYAANASLTIDSSTYIMTLQLKDQDGSNIGNAQTIDLPIESVVVSGSYDSTTKEVVLTLQGGSTIRFSVADLISGLQEEITSSNKLDSDLVDDTNQTNKFVTTSEKTTWNNKVDKISTANQVYGTDAQGAQTSYNVTSFGAVDDVQLNGTSVVTNKIANIIPGASDIAYTNSQYPTMATLQDAMDKLLYITPSVSLTGGGTYEIGYTKTSTTLNWTWNKTITLQSLNQGIGGLDASLRTYTYNTPITSDTTFTITGTDGQTTKTSSTTVSFKPKRYWGVSTATSLTDADIIALSSELSTSRTQTRTFDCSGGKYFYFVIRTSYCSGISFKVGGLAFSDMDVETRNVVNAQGYTAQYNIYRVHNLQTGSAITVEVL